MTEVALRLDVPSDMDTAMVERAVSLAAQAAISDLIYRANEQRWRQTILENDSAMLEWARQETRMKFPPVVRAHCYETLRYRQEFADFAMCKDGRRPVLMRGAKELLQHKYATKSAYAETVVRRYLRFIRFTSFSWEEAQEFVDGCFLRCSYETHRRGPGFDLTDYKNAFVGGERRNLTEHQFTYLKRMHEIARKTVKLEQTMARAS